MVTPDHVYVDTYKVLHASIEAIEHKDVAKLRDISDRTVDNSLIFQDKLSIRIAMLMYALAKVMQSHFASKHTTEVQQYLTELKTLAEHVNNRNEAKVEKRIQHLFEQIKTQEKTSLSMPRHLHGKASLNKSLTFVESGLSVAQAAQLTGATQWQLYKTIGKTRINDDGSDSVANMRKRLTYTLELFAQR